MENVPTLLMDLDDRELEKQIYFFQEDRIKRLEDELSQIISSRKDSQLRYKQLEERFTVLETTRELPVEVITAVTKSRSSKKRPRNLDDGHGTKSDNSKRVLREKRFSL